MRTILTFSMVLALAAGGASAGILLQDNFNDNSLDAAKWWVNLAGIPQNPKSATEQNQRMELEGRAHLVTVQEFDPATYPGGIEISGTWQFADDDDMFQVLTRSDGQPSGSYGETQTGVEFYLQQWSTGSFTIRSRGGVSVTNLVEHFNSLHVSPNDTFSFTIFDDGTNLSFSL